MTVFDDGTLLFSGSLLSLYLLLVHLCTYWYFYCIWYFSFVFLLPLILLRLGFDYSDILA